VQFDHCPLKNFLVNECPRGTRDLDFHCPVTSLPVAFRTELKTIPSAGYLPPISSERVGSWEDRLGPHDRLRVGLVWSGNPKHGNDRNRSIPLRLMTSILDVDATFVSLQMDPRPDDKAASPAAGWSIRRFT
jgi:hypothetical protein